MSGICTVAFSTEIVSGVCAVAAAGCWFGASLVRAPIAIPRDEQGRIAVGGAIVPAVERLMAAVGLQSKLNAIAAAFAGVAALLQVGHAFMPTCWD